MTPIEVPSGRAVPSAAARSAHPLTAVSFSKQFLLATQRPAQTPPRWLERKFGRWSLYHCPDLPVKAGVDGGLQLGWAAAGASHWVHLHPDGDEFGLELDPCGFLGVVYSPSQHVVASTAGLIEAPEADPLNLPEEDVWYPFGLTGRRGVHRLLPNHRLSSRTFTAQRVRNPTLVTATAKDEMLLDEIAERLRENVEAVARLGPVELSLTGGHDSRIVLAAARRIRDRMAFVTTRLPGTGARNDCEVAAHLARRFGFRHQVRKFIPPEPADLEEWLQTTGYCVAGGTWRTVTTSKYAPRDVYRITGLAGEIGRNYLWRDTDTAPPIVREILERIHLPATPALLAAGETWSAGVEGTAEQVLDAFYIEMRLGCWAGPSFYGHHYHHCTFSPYNDREVIERLMMLSPEVRRSERVTTELVRRLWPELLQVPINPEFPGGFLLRNYRVARNRLANLVRRAVGVPTR